MGGRPQSPEYMEEDYHPARGRGGPFAEEDRPPHWSDPRVRYNYYNDGGFFRDRPISFDEFLKWEKWWYEYRDWLQTEGYMGPENCEDRNNSIPMVNPNEVRTLSGREGFGRPEGTEYLQHAHRIGPIVRSLRVPMRHPSHIANRLGHRRR